ncbi:MAG: DUF362 domain-containing protein [Candidatus Wallbacteria bacterium]|nr:DUF362 domain-containing protein [Candidatus Wallbacteria bacterium]
MTAKVYFKEFLKTPAETGQASQAGRELLEMIIREEKLTLEKTVPLKVHFGEAGNLTYLKAENYQGVIDYLRQGSIETCFIETSALYSGRRKNRELHLKLAEEHGFRAVPIEIADGSAGEAFYEVQIRGKHFQKCRLGAGFAKYPQLLVLSHFKGHSLAGFGGAIKNLAMGFASKAGKLDQHAASGPFIIPFLCKKCRACIFFCPVKAIKSGFFFKIDRQICIGCAGCIPICPKGAIIPNFLNSFSRKFPERLVEYAHAAHLGRRNVYLNFIINVTSTCDCVGRNMKPIADDLGVLASLDPVAIDKASLDLLDKKAGKMLFKKNRQSLDYAESLGMGSTKYELVSI